MSLRAYLRTHRFEVLVVLGFLLVGILMFGQNAWHGFIPFDDDGLIYHNEAIRSISPRSVAKVFTTYDPELYIPLTFVSFQLNYLVGGVNPAVYHVTDMFLHVLNALLVLAFVKLLTKNKWIGLACGALFLVHPMHTEAVSWAASRKDTLSTAFFLGSLIAYLRYRATERRKTYHLSIELFLLALLSKIMVVTLPIVLVLIDWMQGRKIDRASLKEKIPYFALSLVFGVIGFFGKSDIVGVSTNTQKFLVAGKSTAYYVAKLLVPFHWPIIFIQETPIGFTLEFLGGWILISLLVALAVVMAKRGRRDVAFGIAFFLITLTPTFLNFVRARTFIISSDRYAYVPSIGFFVAIACALAPLLARWMKTVARKQIIATVMTALVLVFGFISWKQAALWKNGVTIFTDALRYYPESPLALVSRGVAYETAGDTVSAEQDFLAATKSDPLSVFAWYNLGSVRMEMGRNDEAVEPLKRALSLDISFAPAHTALARIFLKQGNLSEARNAFYNASLLDPEYVVERGGFTKEEWDMLRGQD